MGGWLRLPLPFLAWLADASDRLWLEDTCKASEGPCGVNRAREASLLARTALDPF